MNCCERAHTRNSRQNLTICFDTLHYVRGLIMEAK